MFRGGAQQNLRLVETGFQNVQRGFDDQFHANRRRQMKNKFRLRRELRQFFALGNFAADDFQPRIFSAARRFSRLPVEKSSMTTTLLPSFNRRSTRCEPMKPAPPVTRMCFDFFI